MKNNLVIILGAGLGSRLGYPKGLFVYQNKKLIEWHLEQIERLGLSCVLILNKFNLNSYQDQLKVHHHIINSEVDLGPFHSIKLGLEYGQGQFSSYFLLPIDTLPLKNETWSSILKTNDDLVIPSYNQKGGHPPKLSASMACRFLKEYNNYSRMDHFFKDQKRSYCDVDDCNILSNINS